MSVNSAATSRVPSLLSESTTTISSAQASAASTRRNTASPGDWLSTLPVGRMTEMRAIAA